jgi:hypothetical protein
MNQQQARLPRPAAGHAMGQPDGSGMPTHDHQTGGRERAGPVQVAATHLRGGAGAAAATGLRVGRPRPGSPGGSYPAF